MEKVKRMHKRAVLIAGPTASGKSSAAIEAARALNGVIINADSMQVYAGLRILTARPSEEDEAKAPHALYGHVDAATRYSAGQWLRDAREEARKAWDAGRAPIFTGGTGLYFRALEEGLADVPDIPQAIRDEVARMDTRALRNKAVELGLDDALDRQRLARAVSVKLATGKRLEDFHKAPAAPAPLAGADVIRVLVSPPREILRQRIAERFSLMLEQGAAEEASALMARGLDPELPAMKALGLRPLAAAMRGEISIDEAASQTITRTRQYAKRQVTWARSFMADWPRVDDSRSALALILELARARQWC